MRTPLVWKPELYETSGHLQHYAGNMFLVHHLSDKEDVELDYILKPMNCPGHMEVFRSRRWSYRDLPVRFAEFSPLHRNEVSGALGGLTRCRSFCQDDAHLFCKPSDVQSEIENNLKMISVVYGAWFQMQYRAVLSTRPENFLGDVATWNMAEGWLAAALDRHGTPYTVAVGDGAFYGPKIDFCVTDSLGREWQTATIQLDFQLPDRFELEYYDANDQPARPIVIHRAIYGSFERFIGILLEHFDGNLPFEIAPVSVLVVPISDKQLDYAEEIDYKLKAVGVRSELDNSNGPLAGKIAAGHARKIPFLAIVGDKEKTARTVTVRSFAMDQTKLTLEEFFPRMMSLNET